MNEQLNEHGDPQRKEGQEGGQLRMVEESTQDKSW
jgi:hypothetical protein